MYKPTDRQMPLLSSSSRLSRNIRRRLEKSWATAFRDKVFPALLASEDAFADLYDRGNGRPNWSVARKLGICVLQDLFDLTDQEALDAMAFDARWQHALDLDPDDAYLSRRSLLDFRGRLVVRDPEMLLMRGVFERVSQAALEDLGLSTRAQRIDSTFITSNIRTRGRLDLFRKTLLHFLKYLSSTDPGKLDGLSEPLRAWFGSVDDDGYFASPKGVELSARLNEVAGWLVEVVTYFTEDPVVSSSEPYSLVLRLVCEHVDAGGGPDEQSPVLPPSTSDGEAGESASAAGSDASDDGVRGIATEGDDTASTGGIDPDGEQPSDAAFELLPKPINGGASMQSPYDPDAGYGHKGKGYLVQITETCNNESSEIITDYAVQPSNETDQGKTTEAIDRLSAVGRAPDELYADAGYASAEAFADAQERGVELRAPVPLPAEQRDRILRAEFTFDADGHVEQCPRGQVPVRHAERKPGSKRAPSMHAYFEADTCRRCPLRTRCPVQIASPNARHATLDVGQAARLRDEAVGAQRNRAWWDDYRIRSGIEATNSEAKRAHGLGRLRVRGRPRVLMAVSSKLIACNVKRWIRVVTPRSNQVPTNAPHAANPSADSARAQNRPVGLPRRRSAALFLDRARSLLSRITTHGGFPDALWPTMARPA